uniref:7TM_GPCR_Srx domain-containing protein n=1 Tax=Rhabditophanes sp. KR3021 TaxID=114890 RepID=A0AC35TSW0_9BILA
MDYYIFKPNFTYLLELMTCVTATTQIMFSLSLGQGCGISLSFYNRKNQVAFYDALIIMMADTCMYLFGGSVVFSILGFLVKKTNRPIESVVTSGHSLAFITYPEASSILRYGSIWGFLYYFVLYLIGVSTQICGIECFHSGIFDSFKSTRNKKGIWIIVVVGACFVLGLKTSTTFQ